MAACADCTSWISLLFAKHIQTTEKANADDQGVTRRTVLSIRQNAKDCSFCRFIASEIDAFPDKRDPELFKDKSALVITDDQTALVAGKWKTHDFGGERGHAPILESIHFQIYKPTGNQPPWQYAAHIGNYPVCIEGAQDNILSEYILTQLPDQCPVSDKSLEKIRAWIKDCDTRHTTCTRADSTMPSRIIDLSEYHQLGTVKLIESNGRSGEYVTLSHCWGTSRSFTTTTETLDQRKCGITVQDLPKTFQDAIEITSLLHLRYLWIDSICIVQDDPNDWEKESSEMARVYSNSYLTIAAARSADDIEGFLGDRTEWLQVNIDFTIGNSSVFVLPVEHDIYSELETGRLNAMPLHTRAWALQERYLPKRVIHFGQDLTYWECNCYALGEWERWGESRASSIDGLLEGIIDDYSHPYTSTSTPSWIEPWCTLVEKYSSKKLTIASDRLPALAGLARQIADRTGDKYCAGLWQGSLGYGLSWVCCRPANTPFEDPSSYQPERYRGPTWSWASANGPVKYFSVRKEATLCAEFLGCDVQITGQNPYGDVKSGRLKVEAPLIEIDPAPEHSAFPCWDHGRPDTCFALVLWTTPPHFSAIVVKPTLREDGEYWKVGFLPFGNGTPYSEEDVRTITLV